MTEQEPKAKTMLHIEQPATGEMRVLSVERSDGGPVVVEDGLVAFLRARLDEDEAAANAVMERRAATDLLPSAFRPWDLMYGGELDPAVRRLLVEVEAKRQIMAVTLRWMAAGYPTLDVQLRLLALPYADHPSYRSEWKP